MSKPKVAIITSHPIQYNAPLFRLIAARNVISCRVFYTWGETVLVNKYDPGFGKVIQWDIPLLEGYDYEFVKNTAQRKGTNHFRGIINPDIVERIDAFSPDAVLVFGWAFKSHLQVMKNYHNRRLVIFRGDSTLLDAMPFVRSWMRAVFLRWVYHFADYAFYVGTNNLEYFRAAGLRPQQLVYAPHAIDNDRFALAAREHLLQAQQFRHDMKIPENALVYLYAGKLEENKDVITLLEAFVLAGLPASAHLVIVGNGVLEGAYRDKFKTVGAIHFLDFQNQSVMPAVYRVADVFVLPSRGPEETWGLAVNEAMACGVAVLVSDKCGCARDLVQEGKNGFRFAAGDAVALAGRLNVMAAMGKQALGEMGVQGQQQIRHFSFERFAIALESLLHTQAGKELRVGPQPKAATGHA